MDFNKKYGIQEDEKTREFHRGRRMFAIRDGRIYLAPERVPYSHAVWFDKKGWIKSVDDTFMRSIVRGIVDSEGDILFYVGYDFDVTSAAEKEFFHHLPELAKKLPLLPSARVFGGYNHEGKEWLPKKDYGTVAGLTAHSPPASDQ